MRLRDALRHDPGGPSFAGLEPDATPKAPGGKRRTLAKLEERGVELADLQERLYAEATQPGATRRVLLVLQGMDTSGKGGTIKHVIGLVNPQGVAIASFKKPTEEELRHHFLWRVRRRVPAPGMLGIFDRSHYEDVLVARVHHLADRSTIERRYEEINRFEAKLAQEGVAIVKVFLHLSFEEQRERLLARLRDPDKHWKFNPGRRRGAPALARLPARLRPGARALQHRARARGTSCPPTTSGTGTGRWAAAAGDPARARPAVPAPDLDVEELERGLRHDGVVVAEAARA